MAKKSFFDRELPKHLSSEGLNRAEEFDKRDSGLGNKVKVDHNKLSKTLNHIKQNECQDSQKVEESRFASFKN